jgi:hypothetical protein
MNMSKVLATRRVLGKGCSIFAAFLVSLVSAHGQKYEITPV